MECPNGEPTLEGLEEDFRRMEETGREHVNVSKEPGCLRIARPDSYLVEEDLHKYDRYSPEGVVLLPESKERVVLYVDHSLSGLPAKLKSVA